MSVNNFIAAQPRRIAEIDAEYVELRGRPDREKHNSHMTALRHERRAILKAMALARQERLGPRVKQRYQALWGKRA
jgi:hypothetical protein